MKLTLKVTEDYALIPVGEKGIKYVYGKKPGDELECTLVRHNIETRRTILQNKSLHLYLTMIADQLSEAGLDMREVVKLPVTPTTDNVKEMMFKPVMTAMHPDITSTTKLSTKQMQAVYETFNVAMAERLGVSADWPSESSMLFKQLTE